MADDGPGHKLKTSKTKSPQEVDQQVRVKLKTSKTKSLPRDDHAELLERLLKTSKTKRPHNMCSTLDYCRKSLVKNKQN